MNLAKKRQIAARSLRVGKNRVIFNMGGLSEIKEAITKQDIRDLKADKAIVVKEVKGRKKVGKRKNRGVGNIKKKVNNRKKVYATMTRKLRKYTGGLKKVGTLDREEAIDIRKKIRNRVFRSKAHLKEYVGGLKK